MRALLWTAAVTLMAGCVANDGPGPELSDEAAPPAPPVVMELPFSFTAAVDVVASGVTLGPIEFPFWNLGPGPGPDVELEADWTCDNVRCPLRMVAMRGDGRVADTVGDAPLHAEIPDAAPGRYHAAFFADRPGVAVGVTGTLTIRMTFPA